MELSHRKSILKQLDNSFSELETKINCMLEQSQQTALADPKFSKDDRMKLPPLFKTIKKGIAFSIKFGKQQSEQELTSPWVNTIKSGIPGLQKNLTQMTEGIEKFLATLDLEFNNQDWTENGLPFLGNLQTEISKILQEFSQNLSNTLPSPLSSRGAVRGTQAVIYSPKKLDPADSLRSPQDDEGRAIIKPLV